MFPASLQPAEALVLPNPPSLQSTPVIGPDEDDRTAASDLNVASAGTANKTKTKSWVSNLI
jgi:hypothetical protein